MIHVTERPRQALFGLLLARLAGCACLIHAHTVHYPRDATRFANWRFGRADAVVGISHFVADSIRRLGRVPESRVFVVHNAVDGDVFRPEIANAGRLTMRQQLDIPSDVPLIGCAARLMQGKGQATLLDAFAMVRETVPAARLVLAGLSTEASPDGNGDYRDYLMRRIEARGMRDVVTLPGFIPQAVMPHFYGALDVLAHPSLEEPFGLAVVEAMATARPVVAIDGGGIPEIIRRDVDGLLVPAEHPGAMADAIIRLLGDRGLAERLADAGRQRVLHAFTPELQAAAILQVYEQVVARRSSTAVS